MSPSSASATWSRWDCRWKNLPDFKDCGVQLCLNSVWTEQHAEPAPGEFGVWVSLGSRVAWTPAGQGLLRDSGLALGEPQAGGTPADPFAAAV